MLVPLLLNLASAPAQTVGLAPAVATAVAPDASVVLGGLTTVLDPAVATATWAGVIAAFLPLATSTEDVAGWIGGGFWY